MSEQPLGEDPGIRYFPPYASPGAGVRAVLDAAEQAAAGLDALREENARLHCRVDELTDERDELVNELNWIRGKLDAARRARDDARTERDDWRARTGGD